MRFKRYAVAVAAFCGVLVCLRAAYEFIHPRHPSAASLEAWLASKRVDRVELRLSEAMYETQDPQLIRKTCQAAVAARASYNLLEQLSATRDSSSLIFSSPSPNGTFFFPFSDEHMQEDCGESFSRTISDLRIRATPVRRWIRK